MGRSASGICDRSPAAMKEKSQPSAKLFDCAGGEITYDTWAWGVRASVGEQLLPV